MKHYLDQFMLPEPTEPVVNEDTGALNNIASLIAKVPASAIVFNGVAPSVSGIADGRIIPGRRLHLIAAGGPLAILNESALSIEKNRITTGGDDIEIPEGGAAWIVYDSAALRWRVALPGAAGAAGADGAPGEPGEDGASLPIEVVTADYNGWAASVAPYPANGMIRIPTVAGDGDNTNDANYRTVVSAYFDSVSRPAITTYHYSSSSAVDLLIGGRWDLSEGTPRFATIGFWATSLTMKTNHIRHYVSATGIIADDKTARMATSDATPTNILSSVGANKVNHRDVILTASTSTECAVWKFSCSFEGTTALDAGDLVASYHRYSAGASTWAAVLTASGALQCTGQAATGIEWRVRDALQYHV